MISDSESERVHRRGTRIRLRPYLEDRQARRDLRRRSRQGWTVVDMRSEWSKMFGFE